WQVAFADGQLSHLENHLMLKLGDLLYIPRGDFVAAKQRARAAAGMAPERGGRRHARKRKKPPGWWPGGFFHAAAAPGCPGARWRETDYFLAVVALAALVVAVTVASVAAARLASAISVTCLEALVALS